jgi:hypothetical protein
LIEIIVDELKVNGRDIVSITHVGNSERANQIEDGVKVVESVKEVINVKCAGLSSMYADRKGVIVAF